MTNRIDKRLRTTAAAIAAAGLVWLVVLLSGLDGRVYYSIDAATKSLMLRRWAENGTSATIDLRSEPWVLDLWNQGRKPAGPPFIHEVNGESFMAFPLVFPFLTHPFHLLFGKAGLYVWPVATLLGTWALFAFAAHRLELSPMAFGIAFAGLVLGSHMTVYGAIFWEHVPAAFMNFAALAVLLLQSQRERANPRALLLAGLAGGFAIWLRPESVCVQGAAAVACLVYMRNAKPPARLLFAAGVATMLAGYFALNRVVYGFWSGTHALEKAGQSGDLGRFLDTIWNNLIFVSMQLGYRSPVAVAGILAGLAALLVRTGRSLGPYRMLFLPAVLPLILIPLITPNFGGMQWGPRYYLVAVPGLFLWIAVSLDRFADAPPKPLRFGVPLFVAAALVFSVGINTIAGTRHHRMRTGEYRPLHDELENRRGEVIVTNSRHIALLLEELMDERVFVEATQPEEIVAVASALESRGADEFTYLVFAGWKTPLIEWTDAGQPRVVGHKSYRGGDVIVTLDGKVFDDKTVIYDARIERVSVSSAPSAPPSPLPEP